MSKKVENDPAGKSGDDKFQQNNFNHEYRFSLRLIRNPMFLNESGEKSLSDSAAAAFSACVRSSAGSPQCANNVAPLNELNKSFFNRRSARN